jgi:tetratricopeptide (TPR) repeat protein
MAVAFGQDFGVVGHAYSAYVLGMTGRPDAARVRSAQAVVTAERIAHPHSLALALALRGSLHHALRDISTVRQNANRLRDLSVAQGFAHWEMEAYHLLSWVAAIEGRFDEAFDLTARCAAAAKRLGAKLPHAFFQPTIIEILLLAGRADDAFQAASELMGVLSERHMRWSLESEVARLYGQSLLALARMDDAEHAFVHAMALAERRGARLYELRAACDLADLRLRTERGNDIRDLLLTRLDAFTEGADIHDVLRGRAILDSLAAASLRD